MSCQNLTNNPPPQFLIDYISRKLGMVFSNEPNDIDYEDFLYSIKASILEFVERTRYTVINDTYCCTYDIDMKFNRMIKGGIIKMPLYTPFKALNKIEIDGLEILEKDIDYEICNKHILINLKCLNMCNRCFCIKLYYETKGLNPIPADIMLCLASITEAYIDNDCCKALCNKHEIYYKYSKL